MNQFPSVLLADRLLKRPQIRQSSSLPPTPLTEAEVDNFVNVLGGATVIEYSNVMRYYEEHEGKPWGIREMFGLRPPFGTCWLECSNACVKPLAGALPARSGVLIHCSDSMTSEEASRMPWNWGWLSEERPEKVLIVSGIVYQHYRAGVLDGRSHPEFFQQVGACFLLIAEDGRPLTGLVTPPPKVRDAEVPARMKAQIEGMADTYVLAMASEIFPALLAIQFCNCKNIKLASHAPEPKQSKAHEKRGGKPLLRYHTIEIEPLKQVLRTEGDVEKNGLRKALHIVRGHFANYTPEKPLFGRVTGKFWIPAHVRGDASEGIVAKDYRVKV